MASVKKILMAATALTMMSGVAMAGNGNELYLDQTGTNGTVNAQQSGNNNAVGTFSGLGRGRQAGSNNSLVIIQSGNNNFGTGANLGLDQLGSSGEMRLEQTGNNNSIIGMSQFGADNTMRVYQRSNSNTINALVQDTDGTPTGSPSNFMQIIQENGNLNDIGRASQDGTGNDMRLIQSGSRNAIALATQGDFNVSSPNNTNDATMVINQSGDRNVVDRAEQFDTGNSMTLNVSGSSNGTSAMTSPVVGFALGKANLYQSGTGNLINASLSGNNNSFSFQQEGTSDTLVGTIGGDGNQVATHQFGGSGNSINFNIPGSGNALGLTQTGTNNSISATMAGNNGVQSMDQSGSGNTATIVQ